MTSIIERYKDKICGVLSCYDRIVITGTLPDICHADAMTRYLSVRDIRIFDFVSFAEPLRDEIRAHAEKLAKEAGLEIDYIGKKHFRKETRIQEILAKRGNHPGLVHIFSALEPCTTYQPWHNKNTHRTFLKTKGGQCLHYYFYFIHPELGLCYLRVPTWIPFRLQFYCNGHHLLASQLKEHGIGYKLADNAFLDIDDFGAAQKIADGLEAKHLHKVLDAIVRQYFPVVNQFLSKYHWSLMQTEYATDIVFKSVQDLQPLYEALTRTAIHTVKPEHIATFLGRKLNGHYEGEMGNDYHVRIEGARIKHQMGRVSIKMYDKLGCVLRIETTANDVTFFKHHRKVEHRDGTSVMQLAPVKKSIYSLGVLRELMGAANRRYLEFISEIADPTAGVKRLEKISQTVHQDERSYRGFNLFAGEDISLFEAIVRGEFTISGFKNRNLRQALASCKPSQISRMLSRLRMHGLIKKIGSTYKYYLTQLGKQVAITALKLRQMVVIPSLAEAAIA